MTKLQYAKAVQTILGYKVSERELAVIFSCHKMGVSKEGCYTILADVKANFTEKL